MSLVRPIGFSPAEISALVNDEVLARHAEEAAFLWTLRTRAVSEPHYSLKDLARLDERVEAHLAGLRVASDAGWQHCEKNLALQGAGEVFAASVLAFGSGDRDRMRKVLHAGCGESLAMPGLISALGWLDYKRVWPWISRLLHAELPLHRAVGLAACAIHRVDPGEPLAAAVRDADPLLRARALRMVGEMKRRDLLNDVRAQLDDHDDACRFWAAWALALNGVRDGVTSLIGWFDIDTPLTTRALHLALRAMNVEEGRVQISGLAKAGPARARAAVLAAGIVGDPAVIPWLIRSMESSDTARLAGEAFAMITGLDLAYHDLDRDPPDDEESLDEFADLDYETNLRWPSPDRVDRCWDQHSSGFAPGIRYLAGREITEANLAHVLIAGKQRQRMAAALQLALIRPEQHLVEVRARAQL